MTRIIGVALDPESGAPIRNRPVYAFVAPRDAPMSAEPINPPHGVDRTKTNSFGQWELNLRRTQGTDANYIIRVWQHSSTTVDVPVGPGPVSVDTIIVDPDLPNLPDVPDNWQYPQYIPVTEKAQPSGVATLGPDGKLALAQRWAVSGGGGEYTGSLAYLHEQDMPSSVWLVTHDLGFIPSGVVVTDHLGQRHFPEMTYPTTNTIQMHFSADVRGVAHLS